MKTNNCPPNRKEYSRKREDGPNYNDYNRRSSANNNNNYKKRYEQPQPRSGYQNDRDKKSEVDLKKLIARFDPLSREIYEFQKSNEQTSASLVSKLYLRDLIYCNIAPHFAGCGLYIVGSSLNGFSNSSGSSDLDLCLMITSRELDQRTDAALVLTSVMQHLEAIPLIDKMELIFAKVPILRATFHAPFDKIVIDLNANNAVAIRNTHLLCYYSGFDWRVRPLICTIKEWAKRRGINNANHSSLTSYSLVLMALHYLQCGVSPAILPSLQNHYPDRFSTRLDVRDLDISQPLTPIRNWAYGRNSLSLNALLKGFFRYYAYEFDFDSSAISVRLGKKVDRAFVVSQSRHNHQLSQWHCICIEEPFTLSNAAHSVFDERVFVAIKESFEQAYKELEQHNKLEAILKTEPIQSTPDDLTLSSI